MQFIAYFDANAVGRYFTISFFDHDYGWQFGYGSAFGFEKSVFVRWFGVCRANFH